MGLTAEQAYAAAKGYTDKAIEGGGGTLDYEVLRNQPSVNGNTLIGNKTSKQLGIQNIFTGTTTEWSELSSSEKAQYTHVCFTDDTSEGGATVIANPTGEATAELTKLQVDDNIYSIPSGEVVADNTGAIEAIVNEYGAKNLLPCTATTATSGNVTFTVNSDGSVTVDTGGAAADANRYINVGIPSLKEGDKIILSGCPNNPDLWQGTQIDINGVTGTEQHGEELHLTVTADMVNQPVRVRIAAGQELSNYTFYPMIRDARIADSTYVPYAMTNRELTPVQQSATGVSLVKIGGLRMLNVQGGVSDITAFQIPSADRPSSFIIGSGFISSDNDRYYRLGCVIVYPDGTVSVLGADNYNTDSQMTTLSSGRFYGSAMWYI